MTTLLSLCEVKDLLAAVVSVEAALRNETGLNLNQAFAVCCLAKGPLSAGALANELRIREASLSRVIKTLWIQGLLHWDLSGVDGRKKVLTLTPQGEIIAQQLTGYESQLFPFPVQESAGRAADSQSS